MENRNAETPRYVPGLSLAERFYHGVVKPLLDSHLPDLRYSSALLGSGSEVLGFDTPLSRDHDWGPRCQLFLEEQALGRQGRAIQAVLRDRLPVRFLGYPTNFEPTEEGETTWMVDVATGPVNSRVELLTVRGYFADYLGVDPTVDLSALDWLTFSEQKLRAIVSGRVFHDGLGLLCDAQHKFTYYPRDVWLYLLAAQWTQIGQEEAFVGRAGDVGDELGSRLVAAKLVRYVMRLGFLMERTYAPYSKWFGSAFARLGCGERLSPVLRSVMEAANWLDRQGHLSAAYGIVAEMHNELGLGELLDTGVSKFFDRPYLVIRADRFVEQIRAAIQETELRDLPPVGSVNQFVDSTDILERPERCRWLATVYDRRPVDR